ncbi:MAG: hypothetical protein PHN75_04385 [Syntrophales bacterium]|nr:hypothetical protein [Syntrophales bacterium]
MKTLTYDFTKLFAAVFLFTIVSMILVPEKSIAQDLDPEADKVLTAGENLFNCMKEKNYTGIWQGLTKESREDIVKNVMKQATKSGERVPADQIADDFDHGGVLAKAYWDAYVNFFNPDMVLTMSTWRIQVIEKNYAEISLQFRKADKPAILKLKKENGVWRVGLEETFSYVRELLSR